jgi:hypothetical protein
MNLLVIEVLLKSLFQFIGPFVHWIICIFVF